MNSSQRGQFRATRMPMAPPLVAQRGPMSPGMTLYDTYDQPCGPLSAPSSPAFSSGKYLLQDDAHVAEEEYRHQSTRRKIITGILFASLAFFSLYVFMIGIKFIENGLSLALGCSARGIFDFANNPVAGLMIGTVATAVIHSSSTVTSITVALVGTGAMSIRQAVPVVMGANVGTCITCIIVAFAQVTDRDQFERAMAAATIHDMYNIWSVIVMFPIEVAFHPLEKLALLLAGSKKEGASFNSPVDTIVNPLTSLLVVVDKKRIDAAATGNVTCDSLIKSGAMKNAGLSDSAAGGLVAALGFLVLVCSLLSLVRVMARLFLGPTKRVVARALDYNGYLNILVGAALTFWVQSSTLVTSTLTPMAGLGVISLEKVYPLVIGANLGTTSTAMLAGLVSGKTNSMALALVHVWFNLFGVFLFYPIPFTRRPIFVMAKSLASWSAAWPFCAVLFIAVCFVVVPTVGLVITYLCTAPEIAARVVGWMVLGFVVVSVGGLWFWYSESAGREKWSRFLERKRMQRFAQDQTLGGSMDLAHGDTVPMA